MARKRNLTLALDEDLVVKARVIAARQRTSLTKLVRRGIEELVSGDRMQSRAIVRLKSRMSEPMMKIGGNRWTREELHDRSGLR